MARNHHRRKPWKVIQIAREFAEMPTKRTVNPWLSLVGMNHWYHPDMNYRGVINMLMLCGCIGKSGGGWSHYVGQENYVHNLAGPHWRLLLTGTDHHATWTAQVSSTTILANGVMKIVGSWIVVTRQPTHFPEHMLDYNIRAERAGWLPSAPQLNRNPLTIANEAKAKGMKVEDYGRKPTKWLIKFCLWKPR